MLLRRLRGQAGVMDLAAELGVPHSRIQTMLRQTALQLIVPHLDDIAAWARARSSGASDRSIAELSGVHHEIVALALDGWPTRGHHPTEGQVVMAYEAWVAGAPLAEVAALIHQSPSRFRQDLVDGASSLPVRMQARDLVTRFGWHPATVTRHRQERVLPPPDGRDGSTFWWWASTIQEWADRQVWHTCTACPISYLTETGLRGHMTRVHGR